MKFVWQQILSFLLVIVTALGVSITQIENIVTNQIVDQYERQLLNLRDNVLGEGDFWRNEIERAERVLAGENVEIEYYSANTLQMFYPQTNVSLNDRLSEDQIEQLKTEGALDFRRVKLEDPQTQLEKDYLVGYIARVDVEKSPDGYLALIVPLDYLQSTIDNVRQRMMMSLVIAVALAIIISVIYTIYQTQKIKRLQRATQEIAQGNYQVKINTKGRDEFGDLARDFAGMAQALSQSEAEVARQEAFRHQFIMDLAHEMRTPLTTMSLGLEGLMYDLGSKEEQAQSIETLYHETQRLTRMVNENLDNEKIQSGELVLHKENLDLADLLEQRVEQMRPKAEANGNELTLNVDGELKIKADQDRLTQVIINLITNAIQFSHDTPIEVTAYSSDRGICFQVRDHGIGIAPDQLDAIWERFYKVDSSRKSSVYGESGIGLSVVRAIIKAHGGRIDVESVLNQGSTFTVYLPYE